MLTHGNGMHGMQAGSKVHLAVGQSGGRALIPLLLSSYVRAFERHSFSELEQCKYASNHTEYSEMALLVVTVESNRTDFWSTFMTPT